MHIEEVDINRLDIQQWNELLVRSEVCDPFQTYEWAQVLRNSMNVLPHFLLVKNKEAIIGGVMFFRRKILGFMSSYEVRGGPLYIEGNKAVVMKSVLGVLEGKKGKSVYLLFIPFPLINSSFEQVFKTEGYCPFPFSTVIIDLRRSLEDIWRALDKRARRRVRKAEREGVKATVARTWKEWKEYYGLHVLHSGEKGYPPDQREFFEEMFKLHHRNMSRLFVAKHGNRIVAGVLCLIYRKNMVSLQSASLSAFLKYNPNNLVRWKSIEWAGENGITTYDLGGLPWEKTPYLRGVYEFKKQWDGFVQWYNYYLNRRLLYRAMHMVQTNSLTWGVFSRLRNSGVV